MTKLRKRPPHTPGPWRTERSGDKTLVRADLGTPIYRTVHDRPGHEITKQTLAAVFDFDDTLLPRDANARLIAAAPDLLAAIVALYNVCEIPYWAEKYVEARNGAVRAIAKATEEGGA